MSYPNRNNPYSFEPFVEKRDSFDFYADDPFLQKLVRVYSSQLFEEIDGRLREFSKLVSGRWRLLSERGSLPENRPWLMHYDGHNRRIDRIVRPMEIETLEREVYSTGLFSKKVHRWERLTKYLLLQQLGEAGINCSLACTEGLINLIEAYKDTAMPEVLKILEHCTEGIDGDFGIGAQFVTEIQGGSDVPANMLEAIPSGKYYKLYGTKFFCSAIHADYAVVTAKVTGTEEVSTFIVPSWLEGDKIREKRNGFRINRLKRKLGTIELPTAEIEYDGAIAYPIGPLGKGVQNIVGYVLTQSRFAVSVGNVATAIRVAREARMYAEFRTVFGQRIIDLPLTAREIEYLQRRAEEMAAGLYRVYSLYLELGAKLTAGLPRDTDLQLRRKKFLLRILVMLQKITTAKDSTLLAHKAMSVFAGNGMIEDFSALPRLFRDSVINEQWEGPRNLLLHQIHRDLQRVYDWYPPKNFVADMLYPLPPEELEEEVRTLDRLLKVDFRKNDRETRKLADEWDLFLDALFHRYQEVSLSALDEGANS